MIGFAKRAPPPNALIILRRVMTYNLRLLHLYTEMLFHKINSVQNREE